MSNEPLIRGAFFLGIFTLVAVWEAMAPRRSRQLSRWQRWPGNLGIVALNTALVRLLLPTTAAAFALLCEQRGWGALNIAALPQWLAIVLAVLALDLALYLQHALFHAVPPLWRLHRMHHADLEFDATTGIRFHPAEILLSMAIKFAVIVLLGAPALAVLIFEVLLNGTSLFNHANLHLPARLDRLLRLVVVTPDMHRVHHSIVRAETDSNFGFNLPWWDRLFGTYRAQPAAGHDGMTIGVPQFRDRAELRLDRMLIQPLRRS